MKEIDEEIRIAEEKVVVALKEKAKCTDSAFFTYMDAELWFNGCKLGRLHRNRQITRDIETWTRTMINSAGEEIIPLLGAFWRIQDHFEPHTMSYQVMEEVFEIYTSLQHEEPEITAQTVFKKMDVEWNKALYMLLYINAIYAGWEEFKHPTFITQQIQDVLVAKEQSDPTCKYAYSPEGVDRIEFSLQKFPYGMDFDSIDVASIFINGRSMREIIEEAELPSATRNGEPKNAGSYAWLTVYELLEELMEERNPDDECYIEPRVLDCGCGCSECWPLYVNITETEDRVIWSRFYNPWTIDPEMVKIPWDYSGMRKYHFDKKQYYAEIEKLKKWYEENKQKE